MLYVRKPITKKQRKEHDEWVQKHATPKPSAAEQERDAQKFFAKQASLRAASNRTPAIPSHESSGGQTPLKAPLVYTGTKMLGIGVMHKSNSVPIFSEQEAIDIATMRRN